MTPVTWDRDTPAPVLVVRPAAASVAEPQSLAIGSGLERAPTIESADLRDELAERTLVTPGALLPPRFIGHTGGRASVLAQLEQLARAACQDGQLGFSVIVGEPGIGKRRLIDEVVARVRTGYPSALVMRGIAAENANGYGPVSRALTSRFGLVPGEDPEEARTKIHAAVAAVVPEPQVLEVAHLIAHMLRVPFEDSAIVTPLLESPQQLEARRFMALRRLIGAQAEHEPVVFVIENLELCRGDTINFIQYMAAGLQRSRLLVLCTAAATLADQHPTFGAADIAPIRIELGPLSEREEEELVRELCHPLEHLPAELLAHIHALGGSPRVIHELVRLLVETNTITRDRGMWRVDPERLRSQIFPTCHDEVVAARLAVMDAVDRRVLEMAAVVGETFWLDAILALERSTQPSSDPDGPTLAEIAASGDHSRIALIATIEKLRETEWIVEVTPSSISGERELRFASPKLSSIVYAQIEETRRRGYHAVVARWSELHPDGRGPSAQEQVARHLALAGEARDAAIRYRRAAEAARAQYANETAIRLFDRALDCLSGQESSDIVARLHIWHDLGSVYELIGDFDAALGAFERMLRLSWVVSSKTKAAVAFNKMGRVWRRKGDLKLALDYLERGHELFRDAGDQRGIAGSLDDIGRALHMLGRYEEAHAKITQALARRGKSGDKRAIATSLSRLGNVQYDRGQLDSAWTCHREALGLRMILGDRWGCVVSQNHLAALAFELGDLPEARKQWTVALAEAEAIGALPLCALVLTNLGELAIADGKLDEARRTLDDALEIIDEIADRGLESECCRQLASLEKRNGRVTQAKHHAERALQVAKTAGLREKQAQAYLTLGDVLSMSIYDTGDPGEPGDPGDTKDAGAQPDAKPPAAIAFGNAIELLRNIRNESALGKALCTFGRYKVEVGEVTAGRDMICEAIAMLDKLGLGRAADEAKKLLANLN